MEEGASATRGGYHVLDCVAASAWPRLTCRTRTLPKYRNVFIPNGAGSQFFDYSCKNNTKAVSILCLEVRNSSEYQLFHQIVNLNPIFNIVSVLEPE